MTIDTVIAVKISSLDKYATDNNKETTVGGDIITESGRTQVLEKITSLARKKPSMSLRIQEARDQGGLEENEELHMALEELQRIEMDIQHLQNLLSSATVLLPLPPGDLPKVVAGAKVTIRNLDNNRIITYRILGEYESDPSTGSISFKSPLGKELMGTTVGEIITLERKNDFIEYEVMKVES
jgi:transcription elongation factor GreA